MQAPQSEMGSDTLPKMQACISIFSADNRVQISWQKCFLQGVKPLKFLACIVVFLIIRYAVPKPGTLTWPAWQLFAIFVATILGVQLCPSHCCIVHAFCRQPFTTWLIRLCLKHECLWAGLIIEPLPIGAVALVAQAFILLTGTLKFELAFVAFGANDTIWLIVAAYFFGKACPLAITPCMHGYQSLLRTMHTGIQYAMWMDQRHWFAVCSGSGEDRLGCPHRQPVHLSVGQDFPGPCIRPGLCRACAVPCHALHHCSRRWRFRKSTTPVYHSHNALLPNAG